MRIADCPLEKKSPSEERRGNVQRSPEPPTPPALRVNATTYSQTGCSGLAPAPELFALRGSGCRNLALRAFVNKPQPFCPALTGSSFAELDAHNSAAEAPGEHITGQPSRQANTTTTNKKTVPAICLLDTTHSRGGCANRLSLTGPWQKGLYNCRMPRQTSPLQLLRSPQVFPEMDSAENLLRFSQSKTS